uniref:Uncharacterized protein n=1 Tax=Quercus lobata TaxID=97700 RepID=A0A7N2R0S5_QUELO
MAWALVSAIKDQLSSFIASEFLSIANFKGEVQKLESKFHTIQAMLNDAEKRQVKEEAVKLWLDKLKDVSYQMDDVLDEWNTAMIKAEIEKQQKDDAEKAETSSAAKKRKVWPLISVPTLLQHRDIAHKIKELNEKLDEIDREGEVYTFALTRGNEEVERPRTTSFVDVSEILGRDKVRDDLVSILLGKGSEEVRNPHVISLVGMGGIGKTTLAQLAYNDDEVKAHFEIKVWVCVSDPFNQGKVAKEIFESIKFQSPNMTTLHIETKIFESIESQSPNMTALQTLLEAICKQVEGKKFFLVLDDVWTEGSTMWEPFRLALKYAAQGSRILVTTRKSRVAEMMGSVSIINLEVLSKEDCCLVFSKIAFFDRDPKQREQLEDLGTQIVEKCKGLPLAAKTLGSLMQFKRSREEWKSILDNNFWEFEDVERSLYAPLLLSYYDLSSPLRRCFSFCAVFPKDYVFSSDELVFMWMSQGYIKPKANMEIEIIAREYFENLAIRSFFQDFEKDEDDDQIIRDPNINFPRGFGRLTSLRTLKYFHINGEDDRCKLGELRNLNHLKGTLQINGLENVVDQCEATNAQLKKKINLRTLKLLFHPNKWDFEEITRGMDALVLNALEPPPNLEDLSIRYYKGPTMSPWMVSLTNLKNLNFEYLFIEHFPPLGKLPSGKNGMGLEEKKKKKKTVPEDLL